MAVVFFLAGMFLYTRLNSFPFYYHPDESGKVIQILNHSRNLKHPLLLLTATRWMTAFHVGPLTGKTVVETGRTASAFFSVGAVFALAMLARRMGNSIGGPLAGVLAGWSAGLLVLVNPSVFEFAHYMKEDPALAMGMALAFLAAHAFWTRKDDYSIVLLGAATAVAASGKYVGWILFPISVALLHAGREKTDWKRSFRLFIISFAALWSVLNYSFFLNPFKIFSSLTHETVGVVEGHRGYQKSVPHADYLRLIFAMPGAITALFGVYLAGLVLRFRKTTMPEWIVPGASLLLLILMSCSPKSAPRYFLPVEVVICFGAGLAASLSAYWLTGFLGKGRKVAQVCVWTALLGFALWNTIPALAAKYEAITVDDRDALKAWISANLPVTAIIAEDARVCLPVSDDWIYKGVPRLPQRVLCKEFVADLGSLEEMRAQGITHVIVAAPTFQRFDLFTPSSKIKHEFDARAAFYRSLGVLQNSSPVPGVKCIWSAPGGTNIYLRPGLSIFDISSVVPKG